MKKNYTMRIEGTRIYLTPLTVFDLTKTLEWRTKDRIKNSFFDEDLSFEKHLNWYYDEYNHPKHDEDDFVFIILDDHTPVGQIAIYNIDYEKKSAEFGRLMLGEDKYLRKGYATLASKELLKFSFNILGLDHIYLSVKKDNTKAINLYEKLGFKTNYKADGWINMCLDKENYV